MCEWKEKVTKSFDECVDAYETDSKIQAFAACQFAQYLPNLECPKILEIGCGTGILTNKLLDKYQDGKFHITDISSNMVERARSNINKNSAVNWTVMDGENPSCSEKFDLIVSNMSFQWFEKPKESLEKLCKFLNPNGKIFYTVPGKHCFKEWRNILDDLKLQSGMLKTIDWLGIFKEEELNVQYESSIDFLRSIKTIGAGTPRNGYKSLTHAEITNACRTLDTSFHGKISWHIMYGCINKEIMKT